MSTFALHAFCAHLALTANKKCVLCFLPLVHIFYEGIIFQDVQAPLFRSVQAFLQFGQSPLLGFNSKAAIFNYVSTSL
jgi:hypothetical protein